MLLAYYKRILSGRNKPFATLKILLAGLIDMRQINKRKYMFNTNLIHTYVWKPYLHARVRDPTMCERFRNRKGVEVLTRHSKLGMR